jgi:DNA-binding NarL/FixJ family response regulator
MAFDPIALLDAAYAPQRDARAWLRANALPIVASIDEAELGAIHYFSRDFVVDPRDADYQPGRRSRFDRADALTYLAAGAAQIPAEHMRHGVLAVQQPGVHGFVETFGSLAPAAHEQLQQIRDSPAIVIPTEAHTVAIVAAYTHAPLTMPRELRALWQHLAIHLGAACRLSGRAADLEAPDIDAIVDARGRVIDARGAAAAGAARVALCDGVRRRDRARTRAMRANPLGALRLWTALVAGRWSLVDRTDSDGRRFVLARRNDPAPAGQASLSRRQQQVLFYASVGWSFKQIAYALGLSSEGSVTRHVRAGLDALGIASRTELIRATTEHAMRQLGHDLPGDAPEPLAPAERAVAELAAGGWSNARIAARRRVSVHTIVNQLTNIYRKAGVRDRYELAAWIAARPSTTRR